MSDLGETLDQPLGALCKASAEFESVVQMNGFGKGDDEDKVLFTVVVCATDDLEFNTIVKNRLGSLVQDIQDGFGDEP
jgi:hypothetical protein